MWNTPYRELSLVEGGDRDYFFSFEDQNSPLIHSIADANLPMRSLYDFPDGTTFVFETNDEMIDITRSGTWVDENKEIKFSFVPADTEGIERDRKVPYKITATFPNGKKYPILAGHLHVWKGLF